MTFISGAYNWKFAGVDLGITADAPILTVNVAGQPITADLFGGEPVDELKLGSTATLQIVFQEANESGLVALLDRFGVNQGLVNKVGCSIAGSPTLADVLRGDAAPSSPCTDPNKAAFLAYRAALAMNSPIELVKGGRLHQVPLLFNLWPYARSTGTPAPTDPISLFEWFSLGNVPTGTDRDDAREVSAIVPA